MGKNPKIYVYMNQFAVHLKLIQHCKLTMLQFKKKSSRLMHRIFQIQLIRLIRKRLQQGELHLLSIPWDCKPSSFSYLLRNTANHTSQSWHPGVASCQWNVSGRDVCVQQVMTSALLSHFSYANRMMPEQT